ncbi:flavodoxin family protein [Lachnospiraceae bacterium NSJ-143]|nr:flavodoxin family protein [Lachnospiraceae bacterium NSJ-143]
MKLVITDTDSIKINSSAETNIIGPNKAINKCVGCFGCWIKTPGRCVIHDGYEDMGHLISVSKEVIIISRNCFGCYSPFVKNVLDRSIPYLHADFIFKDGKMHHKIRYDNKFSLKVYFYGDMSEAEMKTAEGLVGFNAVNFGAADSEIHFLDSDERLEAISV